jgi:hypothetical protein
LTLSIDAEEIAREPVDADAVELIVICPFDEETIEIPPTPMR